MLNVDLLANCSSGREKKHFDHKNKVIVLLSSALEMLVTKLLTGKGQLPDVLQAVSRGLLYVLVLRADEPEEMCDHS